MSVIVIVALPLRATEIPKCVVCGGMAPYRCRDCGAPLCDQECATEHALDVHGILPKRHPGRRRG